MRKMLLTLTAAGVLALPVGATVAGNDTSETPEPAPTTVEPERDRDRDRIHFDDQIVVGNQNQRQAGQQNGQDGCYCDSAQVRERNQASAENETGDGYMVRERNQVRVEDGTGDGPMTQDRNQACVEDGSGDGTQVQDRNQTRAEDDSDATPAQEPPVSSDEPVATTTDDGAQLNLQYGAGHHNGNGNGNG